MTEQTIQKIANLLGKQRFSLTDEKILQQEIANLFATNDIDFQREVPLGQLGTIDFLVEGLGIEIKIKGQSMSIFRQLKRYCEHETIKEILLVTNHAMGLPPEINGKSAYIINLGKSWL